MGFDLSKIKNQFVGALSALMLIRIIRMMKNKCIKKESLRSIIERSNEQRITQNQSVLEYGYILGNIGGVE